MSDQIKAKIANGVPYSGDVARLRAHWAVPSLREGLVISHEDLEDVLQLKRANNRYYPVVNSWMALEFRQNGFFMAWVPKVGVKVLEPTEHHAFGIGRYQRGSRQAHRGIKMVASVPRERLDGNGQQRLDHDLVCLAKVKAAHAAAGHDMAIELPPARSLPRPALIEQGAR